MISTVDPQKTKVAIEWIKKLANGINPIDGSVLSDKDVVNNVHISRCLFYVAELLEEVGKRFNVTRERIRQIEAKALRKLRHPSRAKKLRDIMVD